MKKTVWIVWFLLLGVACQKDDENVVQYEKGSNESINQWIYEQMKRYYYWNDNLPDHNINLSLFPKDYFNTLVYSDDPYSYAYHPSLPETFPQSLRKTYGFDMGFIEYQGNVYGVVLYTLADSPAENAGLHRGVFITSVNGTSFSLTNYNTLYSDLINSDQAELKIVSYTVANGFSTPQQITIYQSFTFGQSVDYSIVEENNKKIGYVYFSHFDAGMAPLFVQVFGNLKNQQVEEIVLDLRYNGGGDVSSAAALCSILASGIHRDDLFIKYAGNENGGLVDQTFEEALRMNESQISFEALRNVHPQINRVYVLCGNHTASASEIVINNLKPYMGVITIGATTVGKDVAGFTIEDERDPEVQGWVLYPSIYKLYNADNQGNYHAGITPVYELNELENLEIMALGTPDETLFRKALDLIETGNGGRSADPNIIPLKIEYQPTAEPVIFYRQN